MISLQIRPRYTWLSVALLGSACVSSRLELPSDHPANPRAKTAAVELAALPVSAATALQPHDHAAPTSDTYVCPMHPEVVRNAPGKCPICGMSLVKKSSDKPQAEHP
jgi:Heavy metal binding domain